MLNVLSLVSKLSPKHVLCKAPQVYTSSFAAAVNRVYPPDQVEKILRERFFIPDDSNFRLDVYLQSAAELSIQNHLKIEKRAKCFEINKPVNPPKDVDAYYEVGATRVSLEVKCPEEVELSPETYTMTTVGRVSNYQDHQERFRELKNVFDSPIQSLMHTKNKDNTLKSFLVESHNKLSPSSSVDDLNVLFVACGNCGNVQDWYSYLYGGEGLFTSQSFYPTVEYKLVDVVVVSNLKYSHIHAQESHDWTLRNVFLLPFVNPHGRASAVSESIVGGLSVFEHHMNRFIGFNPADEKGQILKVIHYCAKELKKEERESYFPTLSKK